MKYPLKLAVGASLALSLPGCAGLGALMTPPAPLAHTTIDDRALDAAWRTFDLALDAINLLTDKGIIVPGTPRAKGIAAAIRKVNSALASAERFAAAGSATDYATALREAMAGVAEIRTALGSN